MSELSNDRLLTVAFVAANILGITKPRLYFLIRKNTFPPGVVIKFTDRQLRISRAQLTRWLEAGGNYDRAQIQRRTGDEK
jgi:predicted DNA-binding transcriptional regulator AlpA